MILKYQLQNYKGEVIMFATPNEINFSRNKIRSCCGFLFPLPYTLSLSGSIPWSNNQS